MCAVPDRNRKEGPEGSKLIDWLNAMKSWLNDPEVGVIRGIEIDEFVVFSYKKKWDWLGATSMVCTCATNATGTSSPRGGALAFSPFRFDLCQR